MKRWRVGVLAVICFGIGIVAVYKYRLFEMVASIVSYPALRLNAAIVEPIKRYMHTKSDVAQLRGELEKITNAYQEMQSKYNQLRAECAYFNGIKELRSFSRLHGKNGKICTILARNFTDTEHSILINAGSAEVSKDTLVCYKDALIGRVIEVYPLYSKVRLITDSQSKIGAYAAATRTKGIHEGLNRLGETALSFVDHLAPIEEGDLVLTSGEGISIGEGYTLGYVIKSQSNGLHKAIKVSPAYPLNAIEYCMIIKA